MGFTGGSFTFIVCLSFMVAVYDAAHIKTEEQLNHKWIKREVPKAECPDSKLTVNLTKEATYVKIVTVNGETLFNVDSTNTNLGDINVLLLRTTSVFFPEPGRVLFGNSTLFNILKLPSENGVKVFIQDKFNMVYFRKEIKGHNEGLKGFSTKCVHLTGFKVVLGPGLDANHRDGYNMTALVWTTLLDERDLAKSLVEKGADVNTGLCDFTPLTTAMSSGDEELVEFLIKHGAKVNQPVNVVMQTPLHLAAYEGRVGVARVLLKHGANISSEDEEGSTPLHYAASFGKLDMVKELVTKGADVNARKRKDGRTPFHTATILGHEDLMNYLLQSGADVDTKTADNTTPLMMAVSHHGKDDSLKILKLLVGHLDMVKELVTKGADVNARTNGRTPLHMATIYGDEDLMTYLIQSGADVNAKTKDNSTPLMMAVSQHVSDEVSLKFVKHLVGHHNADVNARNNKGQTALSFASSKGFSKVQDYLMAHGAV